MAMQIRFLSIVVVLLLASSISSAQIQKFSEPLGNKLDYALKDSKLIQPGANPFHVRLEIKQIKGPAGNYDATVEETWVSPKLWTRTVTAKGLSQTIVVNESGTHYVTIGDYFPNWLREFVMGLTDPVPNADYWDKAQPHINHIEMAGKVIAGPEMRGEMMLGVAPTQQVNFLDVSFQPDGLVKMSLMPGDTVSFGDYQPFGKLRVARGMGVSVFRNIQLDGKVVALDEVKAPDQKLFATPEGATDRDPLTNVNVSSAGMLRLSVGGLQLKWPAQIPGSGMFTVWVNLDKTGIVREAKALNSDLSGFAADMTEQFIGQQWKAAVANGAPVQASGPIVIAYPPAHP